MIIDLPYHNIFHLFSNHEQGQIIFARSVMRLLGSRDVTVLFTEPFENTPFSDGFRQNLLYIKEVVAELELGYVGFSNLPLQNEQEAANAISQCLIVGDR